MTATDELREGLRKRGESWHKWPDEDSTTWQAYSNPHTATESMDGTLIVTGLTPEQAVEATLGRGECLRADASQKERKGLAYENAKLRELCSGLAQVVKNDDDTFRRLREIAKQELSCDFIGMYDSSLGEIDQFARFIDSMAELGIEVTA